MGETDILTRIQFEMKNYVERTSIVPNFVILGEGEYASLLRYAKCHNINECYSTTIYEELDIHHFLSVMDMRIIRTKDEYLLRCAYIVEESEKSGYSMQTCFSG